MVCTSGTRNAHLKAMVTTLVCFVLLAAMLGLAQPALADPPSQDTAGESHEAQAANAISYLPDVTSAMSNPSYWFDKQQDPQAVLADRALIDQLNQAGVDADGTMLQPLKIANERFYTAEEQQRIKDAAVAEMRDVFVGQVYDLNDVLFTQADADQIAANYPTGGTKPALQSGYAIVTTHTVMRCYPTDHPLMYTLGDYDDDNLYLTALRVNEPLLVRARSVDGNFLLCTSSCMTAAWVPTKDVAICKDRTEWMEAWDIPAGQELVVCGYKVRTEQSRVTPATANRMLYMGTVLHRVDGKDPTELVGTRSAYNNHVCYLPVRNADGTYSKQLALIAESEQVSEGFLPLTKANIATVALRVLGQMYGWGGMLDANDCSGYVRDVYKCFGLELARNTTWQMNMPVRTYDIRALDDAHKAAAIAQMPLGTVLFWGGHEMLYLGQDNGKLYVISATGSIGNLFAETGTTQIKGVVVNTLDMVRGNRNTWLTTITTANIPYIPSSAEGPGIYDIAFYEQAITWPDETYDYTGSAIKPPVKVEGLIEGTDYVVSYSDNIGPGRASATVTGIGDYAGSLSRTFEIKVKPQPVDPTKIWKRLGGYGAFGTMDLIVKEGWTSSEVVVIATSEGFYDALAASPLAGTYNAPILLTGKDELHKTTARQIRDLGAKKAIIVGGTSVVSTSVERQIQAMGVQVERYGGFGAQQTAALIASQVAAHADTCIVATSKSYHDALSASPYSYAKRCPIYLTNGAGVLQAGTLEAIRAGGFKRAIILGGPQAVDASAESALKSAGVAKVQRAEGINAIETSRIVAELAMSEGMSANHMGVATANDYYDALTGGPLCGKMGGALVLASETNVSNVMVSAAHRAEIERAYIFGGTAALSTSVSSAFEASTQGGAAKGGAAGGGSAQRFAA